MADDALSNLLRTVRLTGATFFDIEAQDPWAVRSPPPASILPRILPGADHLISYHVVTAGRCFARIVGGQPIVIEAGEVVIFSNSDAHIMSSSPGLGADPPTADVLDIAFAGQMPFHLNYASGGPISAKLVCGYLACDAQPFNPLLEALPPVIKAGEPRTGDAGWLGQFIRFAVAEVAEKRAGGETVLTKLSELMFIDVLRRYVETLPPQKHRLARGSARSAGRQGAVADPRSAVARLDHRGTGEAVRAIADDAGGTLCEAGRDSADALPRQMADADCV